MKQSATNPLSDQARWPRYRVMALLLFPLLGFAVYANSLHSPWYFDDMQNIVNNPHIRMESFSLTAIHEAMFESPHPLRSIPYLSWALNHWVGGYDLIGFHLVNISIHILNAILVYLLVRITLGLAPGHPTTDARTTDLIALTVALLWMLHPLHTQSVTYLVQRMNLLAVMFYLLAFVCYLQARLSTKTTTRWVLLLATTLFAGLAASRIHFTIPVLTVLGVLLLWTLKLTLQSKKTPTKTFELAAGLWTLTLYLILGIVPFFYH